MVVEVSIERLEKLILVLVVRENQRSPWETSNFELIIRLSVVLRALRQRQVKTKRLWVSEAFRPVMRMMHGASESYIETIRRTDPNRFDNFMRMSPQIFDLLSQIAGPVITKQRVVRDPISAKCRLDIRYLATGYNYETLATLFRVGPLAVYMIIKEVTAAIWQCLRPLVLQDLGEDFCLKRAEEFAWGWDFKHCVGGIDRKLITIEAPANSGSLTYDYKGHHSFYLHAISDAYQKFILVDIGAAGRKSDGGVFRNSRM